MKRIYSRRRAIGTVLGLSALATTQACASPKVSATATPVAAAPLGAKPSSIATDRAFGLPAPPVATTQSTPAAVADAPVAPLSPPTATPTLIPPRPTVTPTPRPPVPTATPSAPPRELEIPKIGISASIKGLGTRQNGEMDVPDGPRDVGWFVGSPVPGDPGNAVLTGHLDWRTGETGVFWRLKELGPGDPIFIRNERSRLTFLVDTTDVYPRDKAPVEQILGFAIGRVITIVTCEGQFIQAERDYTHRRVVRARLA